MAPADGVFLRQGAEAGEGRDGVAALLRCCVAVLVSCRAGVAVGRPYARPLSLALAICRSLFEVHPVCTEHPGIFVSDCKV